MKHRLWNFAAILSLLACAAIVTISLITRRHAIYFERDLGYYRGANAQVLQGLDQGYWQGGTLFFHSRRMIWTASGPQALARFHADHPARPRWFFGRTGRSRDIDNLPQQSNWERLGFHNYQYDVPLSFNLEHHRMLAAPSWMPIPLLLLFGLLALRKHWWRPRKRRLRGQCPNCGYDLRASPDRCPECGTSTPAMA